MGKTNKAQVDIWVLRKTDPGTVMGWKGWILMYRVKKEARDGFARLGRSDFDFTKFKGEWNLAKHERRLNLAVWCCWKGTGGQGRMTRRCCEGTWLPDFKWNSPLVFYCVSVTGLHPAVQAELSLGESQRGLGTWTKHLGDEGSLGLRRSTWGVTSGGRALK